VPPENIENPERQLTLRLWIPDSNPKYGNCFTFNSMVNDKDPDVPRRASLTGRDYGMVSKFCS